eukprot:m.208599 g.208599  ORF g.208599 m.208599 type:complete len:1511 (+) comp16929_c0_seq2:118-4650(+)
MADISVADESASAYTTSTESPLEEWQVWFDDILRAAICGRERQQQGTTLNCSDVALAEKAGCTMHDVFLAASLDDALEIICALLNSQRRAHILLHLEPAESALAPATSGPPPQPTARAAKKKNTSKKKDSKPTVDALTNKIAAQLKPLPLADSSTAQSQHNANLSCHYVCDEKYLRIDVNKIMVAPDFHFVMDKDSARQRHGATAAELSARKINDSLASIDIRMACRPPPSVEYFPLPSHKCFSYLQQLKPEANRLEYKESQWVGKTHTAFSTSQTASSTAATTPLDHSHLPTEELLSHHLLPRAIPLGRPRHRPPEQDSFGLIQETVDHTLQYLVEMYALSVTGTVLSGHIFIGVRDKDRCCVGVPIIKPIDEIVNGFVSDASAKLSHLFPAPDVSLSVTPHVLEISQFTWSADDCTYIGLCGSSYKELVSYIEKNRPDLSKPAPFCCVSKTEDALFILLPSVLASTFDILIDETGATETRANPSFNHNDTFLACVQSCAFLTSKPDTQSPGLKKLKCFLIKKDKVNVLPQVVLYISFDATPAPGPQPLRVWRNSSFKCMGMWGNSIFRLTPFAAWAWLRYRTDKQGVWSSAEHGRPHLIVCGDAVNCNVVPAHLCSQPVSAVLDNAYGVCHVPEAPHAELIFVGISHSDAFQILSRMRKARARHQEEMGITLIDFEPKRLEETFEVLRIQVLPKCPCFSISDVKLLPSHSCLQKLNEHMTDGDQGRSLLAKRAPSKVDGSDGVVSSHDEVLPDVEPFVCVTDNLVHTGRPSRLQPLGQMIIRKYLMGTLQRCELPWSLVETATVPRNQETRLLHAIQSAMRSTASFAPKYIYSTWGACGVTTALQRTALNLSRQANTIVLWISSAFDGAKEGDGSALEERFIQELESKYSEQPQYMYIFADTTLKPAFLGRITASVHVLQQKQMLQCFLLYTQAWPIGIRCPHEFFRLFPLLSRAKGEIFRFQQHYKSQFDWAHKALDKLLEPDRHDIHMTLYSACVAFGESASVQKALDHGTETLFTDATCLSDRKLAQYLIQLALLEVVGNGTPFAFPDIGLKPRDKWDWLIARPTTSTNRLRSSFCAFPLLAKGGIRIKWQADRLQLADDESVSNFEKALKSAFQLLCDEGIDLRPWTVQVKVNNIKYFPLWVDLLGYVKAADVIWQLWKLYAKDKEALEKHIHGFCVQLGILQSRITRLLPFYTFPNIGQKDVASILSPHSPGTYVISSALHNTWRLCLVSMPGTVVYHLIHRRQGRFYLNDSVQPAGNNLEEVIQRLSEQVHPTIGCKLAKFDATLAALYFSEVVVAFDAKNFLGLHNRAWCLCRALLEAVKRSQAQKLRKQKQVHSAALLKEWVSKCVEDIDACVGRQRTCRKTAFLTGIILDAQHAIQAVDDEFHNVSCKAWLEKLQSLKHMVSGKATKDRDDCGLQDAVFTDDNPADTLDADASATVIVDSYSKCDAQPLMALFEHSTMIGEEDIFDQVIPGAVDSSAGNNDPPKAPSKPGRSQRRRRKK